jgi:glycosyltransferase involved in cell wall biosynthesis
MSQGGSIKTPLMIADEMIKRYGFEVHWLSNVISDYPDVFHINPEIQLHFIKRKRTKQDHVNIFLRFFKTLATINKINPDVILMINPSICKLSIALCTNKRCIVAHRGSYNALMYGLYHLMGERPGWRIWKVRTLKIWKAATGKLFRERLFPRAISRLDSLIVLTQKDKQLWNLPNVHVIHNFHEEITTVPLNATKECFAIAVGRLEREKNFQDLIKAWAKVVTRHPDLKLKIYGNGSQYEKLKELIENLHLSDTVFLMDFSTNILEKYSTANILVSTTYTEGFGNIYIEAQACGLPVISYDAPNGPGEIIHHGINGLLCPVGDIDGFANSVLRLAGDKVLLEEMSKNALLNIKRFDKDSIMQQWHELFTRK